MSDSPPDATLPSGPRLVMGSDEDLAAALRRMALEQAHVVVGGFFIHLRNEFGGPFHKNVVQYLNYLIADMGNPPTLERAREIAHQSFLEIRYESPDHSWTTSDDLPAAFKDRFTAWRQSPDVRLGKYRGRHVIEIDKEALIAKSLLYSFIAFMATGFFLSRTYTPLLYIYLGLAAACLGRVYRQLPKGVTVLDFKMAAKLSVGVTVCF